MSALVGVDFNRFHTMSSTRSKAKPKSPRLRRSTGEHRARREGEARGRFAEHMRASMKGKGTLIIIGGHEDKKDDRLILRALAARVGDKGKLVVVTVASDVPDDVWADYQPLFADLGVAHAVQLHVDLRMEARDDRVIDLLEDATAVFFTGGDQLKLTSLLGDSPVFERVREIYEAGGTIAGTSAGASVVCETMMVRGSGDASHRIGGALHMAPGFGFIQGVIIDQHFSERGRIGRLMGAVAQNPRILGIGIDENTAIVIGEDACFKVIGEGAVTVLDASDMTYSNLADEQTDRTLSAFGVRLHLLSQGDDFDIASRTPRNGAAEDVERELLGEDE
jgi:cyanophycinase